ncbi:uncharacterized protein LY89DRAFT_788253 [Mollisia scopiformis]|uniref:Zn(2)-C6 fungal-type domain-containing protein n=1 Tax=Mollisia scopiformis TaxID=149040 RepID=A0A132BCJ7_MOLSC|nr:uncharacterized protein LY89DRAFT_788253 [Mollisia scopiformis]KUJ09377.1 hypothetical protein LY89DRAFT_788253 [Mollisia scopiformis]
MPFPSTGCQTCRQRRIKCDGELPRCQRCQKSKRTCSGTRAEPGCSLIHLENSYASGATKRPRGPRSTRTVESIPQLPSTDLETRATTYYYNHHLHAIEDSLDIMRTVADDFLTVWKFRPDCEILSLAGSCMALAVFSRTQSHPPAAVEASLKYERLLRSTHQEILSLNAENIDTCLIAIFFMGRYEGAVFSPEDDNPKVPIIFAMRSFRHHEGAISVLKHWKECQSHRSAPTDVIKHTRRGLIRSALLRNAPVPDWLMEGSLFGEHGLELEYDRIHTRIANLRHRLGTLLCGKPRLSQESCSIAEEFNTEAKELDKSLQQWKKHLPTEWNYQRHTLPVLRPCPSQNFYSSVVYSYANPAYGAVWCKYFATRMLINSTRLQILAFIEPSPIHSTNQQKSQALSHMRKMGNGLASSIPFCFERFSVTQNPESSDDVSITLNIHEDIKPYNASLVLWPLTIATSIGSVERELRLWFRSELARVGKITGFGIAECANTPSWPINKLGFDKS